MGMTCHTGSSRKRKNSYEAPKSIASLKTNFSFINHFPLKPTNTNHNSFSKNNKHLHTFTISPNKKPEQTSNLSYICQPQKMIFQKKITAVINPISHLNNESSQNETNRYEMFISLLTNTNDNKDYSIKVYSINNNELTTTNNCNYDVIGITEISRGKRINFGISFIFDILCTSTNQIFIIEIQNHTEGIITKRQINIYEILVAKNKLNYEIEITEHNNKLNLYFIIHKRDEFCNLISYFDIGIHNVLIAQNEELNTKLCFIMYSIIDGINWRPFYKSKHFLFNKHIHNPNIPINSNNTSLLLTDSLSFEKDLLISKNQLNRKIKCEIYEIQSKYMDTYHYINCISSSEQLLMSLKDADISIPLKGNEFHFELKLNYFETIKKTFYNYIKEGLKLNLEIAIDYTLSNGNPLKTKSLHYLNRNSTLLNDYEQAIKSCASILNQYDYDQKYPVYGFGGITKYTGKDVSMCFNVNLNETDPNVEGLEGILNAYRNSLSKVKLAGPSQIAPVLKRVIENIENNSKINQYTVLMILTDGIINDIQETVDMLHKAVMLPLSIIIIGIGDADFSNMEYLDGDNNLFQEEICQDNEKKQFPLRDIVQFVRFNKYKNNNNYEGFTEETLKELPRQIEEYFRLTGKELEQNDELFSVGD